MEVISVIVMFIFGNMNDQEHRMTQLHEGSKIAQEKGNRLYEGRILRTCSGGAE